jgi:general secretion pathway protein D
VDGGIRPFAAPPRPPPVAPPPPPPPPPPQPTGPSTSLPVTELGFNTCQKIPAGKRAVKMNLKPEVELPELVAWISSITCKSFVLPGHLSAGGKKLTFVTQGTMTPNEAYAVFLTALDSVGLAVERGPGYYKIIETAKAKTGNLPVYGFDGKPTQPPPKRTKSSGGGN